ncbi:MAG: hypothetical protein JW837_00660 [Sedimentisphaerales bacterium]|nr:hypothetical protein [Sedimentisphaerales bacterium]
MKNSLNTAGRKSMIVLPGALLVLFFSSTSPGQRGMGNNQGVAQQSHKPLLVHISGKLQEIKTHPCENTTGKADIGTHLILKDEERRELNIHLGPTPAVSETVKQFKIGKKMELIGFRTDIMPPNQYVAKTLIYDKNIIQLRDSNLRPYWAGSRFNKETLLPSDKTTLYKRTAIRNNCYYSSLKSWQRRPFENGQRPRSKRRFHGRFFRSEW